MLGDPLAIIIDGVTVNLRRINQDVYSSEYRFRDSVRQVNIRIRHSEAGGQNGGEKRDRHNIELTETIFATATTAQIDRKVYTVVEQAKNDPTVTLPNALANKLIGSSNALLVSLLGWES